MAAVGFPFLSKQSVPPKTMLSYQRRQFWDGFRLLKSPFMHRLISLCCRFCCCFTKFQALLFVWSCTRSYKAPPAICCFSRPGICLSNQPSLTLEKWCSLSLPVILENQKNIRSTSWQPRAFASGGGAYRLGDHLRLPNWITCDSGSLASPNKLKTCQSVDCHHFLHPFGSLASP